MVNEQKILFDVLRMLGFAQGFLEISGHQEAADKFNPVIQDVMDMISNRNDKYADVGQRAV